MKAAIYAGSFDPWSFGHQYVLESALDLFDVVHVLAALNPSKTGTLAQENRARIIASAIDPFQDWWGREPPYQINPAIVVTSTSGLVADYAREQEVMHLIRGLRSTTDFEAEFNLYFSNRAINDELQTWAIMCPPDLLHCSSTYVRAVVGNPKVGFIGTSFLAQALMLGKPPFLGELFDLILASSLNRFEIQPADLTGQDLYLSLQGLFSQLVHSEPERLPPQAAGAVRETLRSFRADRGAAAREGVQKGDYDLPLVASLWRMTFRYLEASQPGTAWGVPRIPGAEHPLQRSLGRRDTPLVEPEAFAHG